VMKRLLASIAVMTIGIAGCSVSAARSPDSTLAPFAGCSGDPGSPLDVAGEPDWRQYADYAPWTDANGCLIRIDVLAERAGPEHCGWEKTRVLISGDPLGTRYSNHDTSLNYVRDPGGRYGVQAFVDGFRTIEELPTDAIDSGFRRGNAELWLSPSDPDAVYIWDSGAGERWPKGEPPLCA
jgi:hypothetical protein